MTTRFNTGGRNFGYGKQIGYAVKNALKDRYGEGKFATRAAHEARFTHFTNYLKETGIKDLRKIDQTTINNYGQELNVFVKANEMSISYAQNLLSTVNVVMEQVRGDKTLSQSPAKAVGQRCHIRAHPPKSLDRQLVAQAVSQMDGKQTGLQDDKRAQLTVLLAREFGLRFKETALLNLNRVIKEVTATGHFNVIEGTKGGRTADRPISVTPKQLEILKATKSEAGRYKNLVGKAGSFKQWQNSFSATYRTSGAHDTLGKFHDLRAAYACERYKQLTGLPAPVMAGRRTADYKLDQSARAILAIELGHNRVEILNSYIGSAC